MPLKNLEGKKNHGLGCIDPLLCGFAGLIEWMQKKGLSEIRVSSASMKEPYGQE